METPFSRRDVDLALRLALLGLALLFLRPSSATAQECCPDQYTEAELARAAGSASKPAKASLNPYHQYYRSAGCPAFWLGSSQEIPAFILVLERGSQFAPMGLLPGFKTAALRDGRNQALRPGYYREHRVIVVA
jgi:hypothetical protein